MGFEIYGSGDLILGMNAQLLDWLGQAYFLNLFAVGMAIWMIRLLIALSLGPLNEGNAQKAFMNLILGGVLCAMIITPIGNVPHLNKLLALEQGQYATPAAGLVKRILADGSAHFTMLFVGKAFTPDHPPNPDNGEELTHMFTETLVKWLADFTGMDLVGVDSEEALEAATGQHSTNAQGNEGGLLSGVGNFFDGLKGTYDMGHQASVLIREFMASPLSAVSYASGIFLVFVVGIWTNLLGFAFPFLFCALLFILPISYIFDGMARVMILVKWMTALALSKPLAMLFVTMGFGIIDDYFLELFQQGNIQYEHPTVFRHGFFLTYMSEYHIDYSFPLILSIGLASGMLALFAPVISFLILGADGGMLSGMLGGAYMALATKAANLATSGVSAASGVIGAQGGAGAVAGGGAEMSGGTQGLSATGKNGPSEEVPEKMPLKSEGPKGSGEGSGGGGKGSGEPKSEDPEAGGPGEPPDIPEPAGDRELTGNKDVSTPLESFDPEIRRP